MSEWKLAMIVLAPMMRGRQMLRTWAAVMGASVAAYFVQDIVAYMAIDAIAAAVVMARPAGYAQKAIGAIFVSMLMFDLGFFLSPHNGWDLFLLASTVAGWVQWLILGAWAGHDAWGRYYRWSYPSHGLPPPVPRRIR